MRLTITRPDKISTLTIGSTQKLRTEHFNPVADPGGREGGRGEGAEGAMVPPAL